MEHPQEHPSELFSGLRAALARARAERSPGEPEPPPAHARFVSPELQLVAPDDDEAQPDAAPVPVLG